MRVSQQRYMEVGGDKAAQDNMQLPFGDSEIPCNGEDESREEFVVKSILKQKNAENGGKVIWRIANGFMTVFFVMAVGVQFNDPDPYLWVPLYGVAALLTTCVTIRSELSSKNGWKLVYRIHTLFCSGMFCYVLVQLILVAADPQSDGSLNPLMYEEGRELAGIMITVIWLFTCKQSPTIKCTFPRYCCCCPESRTLEQINVDVLVDATRRSLIMPP